MKRTPKKISETIARTKSGWKVEIPKSISSSGRRERHFFPARDKARDFAEGLAEKHCKVGANMITINPSLAEMATKTFTDTNPGAATHLFYRIAVMPIVMTHLKSKQV